MFVVSHCFVVLLVHREQVESCWSVMCHQFVLSRLVIPCCPVVCYCLAFVVR